MWRSAVFGCQKTITSPPPPPPPTTLGGQGVRGQAGERRIINSICNLGRREREREREGRREGREQTNRCDVGHTV